MYAYILYYTHAYTQLYLYSNTLQYTHTLVYSYIIIYTHTHVYTGGSHLLPTWKKNPKYTLKIRNSTFGQSTSVRICISKYGNKWDILNKKDTVGCMIGFYIFKSNIKVNSNEYITIYESGFVPFDDVVTEDAFSLPPLDHDEVCICAC